MNPSKMLNAHENRDKETSNIDDAVIGFIHNRNQVPTDNVEIVEKTTETTINESTTTEDIDDLDLGMPAHIVRRRNEALGRGEEKRRQILEKEQEEEEENTLDKSD